jgi:hypothetical protein
LSSRGRTPQPLLSVTNCVALYRSICLPVLAWSSRL